MAATSIERPGSTGPLDTLDLRRRVEVWLEVLMGEQRSVLADVDPACLPLVDVVHDLLSGGKRLRAAFCYWGHRGAGGGDTEDIVAAAASLELFQAAALIHDDVMDASDTRRGAPAVHRRFETLHREQGWTGDSERYGAAGAVLAGDLCLGWADELFARSGFLPRDLARGRHEFNRMRTELMGGQYLDMHAQARAGRETPRDAERIARRVLRFKSAKYSVQQPLLIGAALAGEREEPGAQAVMDGYRRFGLSLGEAFQLRDDLLGVFGDAERTGKPAGDDLREGKRTVLVAMTLQRADRRGRDLMERRLGDPDLGPAQVEAMREVIAGCGAMDQVEHLIEELVADTCTVLAATPVAPEARPVLEQLIDAATRRVT